MRKKLSVTIPLIVSFLVSACGGGGSSPDSGGETGTAPPSAPAPAPGPAPGPAPAPVPAPALVGQPVSVVNTTTTGDQRARGIGALNDGGYTVAWISGTTLYMQRYDSAGKKTGTETAIPLVVDPRDQAAHTPASSSVTILSDGSVVVAYPARRSSFVENGREVITSGLYIQRFDSNGVQVLPETAVASFTDGDPRRPTTFQLVQVLAMPEGAYVVGWATFSASATVGSRDAYHAQRFDSQNQRVGAFVSVGAAIGPSSYKLVADAMGGYTAYWSGLNVDFSPTGLMVTHYDASNSSTQVLTSSHGSALLLPLEDGRYVLYTGDGSGAYRQLLDRAGAALGERTPVSSMPVAAQLLADGSYVAVMGTDNLTAQHFDRNGEPLGAVLAMQTSGIRPVLIPLAEGSFAIAWSAPGAGGDLDVYTQRFVQDGR